MNKYKTAQVVLVDDDPDYIYLVEQAIKECNPVCVLTVFHNGPGLLEWLETGLVRPNLILLDINMPGANGFDILKILRSVDRYKMIPVVMLSVSERLEDVGKAYTIGANAYLVKPMLFSELATRIELFNQYWFDISQTPGTNWGDINWYDELN